MRKEKVVVVVNDFSDSQASAKAAWRRMLLSILPRSNIAVDKRGA
jgi:hypothetical protein